MSSSQLDAQQATPPSRVNVKFNAKYPEYAGKADWQQTPTGYIAVFNDKGRRTTSEFTEDGQWLRTEAQLLEKDWRPPMVLYVKENHKGYRYLQGFRYDDAKGSRYRVDLESTKGRYRLDFDGKGNFVNESPLNK